MKDQVLINIFNTDLTEQITAAMAGISTIKWKKVRDDAQSETEAADIMKRNRYDVLPIETRDGFTSYFHTIEWNNYTSIARSIIKKDDIIPATTHIRETIKLFTQNKRRYFFLEHDHSIVGLISIANINSRPVKVYLFSMISEIEVELGKIINQHVDEESVLQKTIYDPKNEGRHDETKKRYEEDRALGVELEVTEYIFLSELIEIILLYGLYQPLDYSKREFKREFNAINDLRHSVAHPTRSLITRNDDIDRLDRRISYIEKALQRLRNHIYDNT